MVQKNEKSGRSLNMIERACLEVEGFQAMYERFRRSMSVLGRSKKTFESYSRYVTAIALHYGQNPLELDAEQVQEYLYMLQSKSKTPSQTFFKHTVFGLRFLL